MKKTIQATVTAAIAALLVGCASTKTYFGNRGRDARDMMNLGAELGSVGASAQAGPIMTGAIFTAPGNEANGWGLVNRGLGRYEYGDWQAIVIGYKCSGTKAPRGRDCGTRQIACFADGTELFGTSGSCPYAMGQVEARVGMGIGLHAGVHMGEIADFFLGWFGIDIFNDDLEAKKKKRNNRTSF